MDERTYLQAKVKDVSDRDRSRLERWLGVPSPGGEAARPPASRFAAASGHDALGTVARTGPSKYAVSAVVVLMAGVLGLGVWTVDLRRQVSSLEKRVAAESSENADVARQLTEAESDLEGIDARLAQVEGMGLDLDGIETRLAELERRIGRRR